MRKAERKAGNLERSPPKVKRQAENTESCDMRLVTYEEFFGESQHPGQFFWKDLVREVNGESVRCQGICARYPGGSVAHLPVRPIPPELSDLNGGHSWGWDGNETKPTLQPSVNIVGSWHGWIRAGRMESC